MLERARERARETGAANVRFQNADAQTHPFAERDFDVVFSRFGVMFFSDAARAFANLRGALREGGRLAFVCWQGLEKNPWMGVPTAAAAGVIPFPPPGPPDAPGPFGFADPARIRRVLEGGGFRDVSIEPLETFLDVGDGDLDRSVEFVVQMGPTGNALRKAAPEAVPRVIAAVKQAVARYHTERGLHMQGAVWIVSALRG
jgi:SAM-dependent methyltransferase